MNRTPQKYKGIRVLGMFLCLLPVYSSASEEPAEQAPDSVQALVSEAQRMAEKWAERLRGLNEGGEQSSTYLGVAIEPVPEVLREYAELPKGVGLLLRRIAPDSPAERGGLRDNDILLSFDGQLAINYDQLSTLIDLKGPGAEVIVRILRRGEEMDRIVVLEERMRPGGPEDGANLPESPNGD